MTRAGCGALGRPRRNCGGRRREGLGRGPVAGGVVRSGPDACARPRVGTGGTGVASVDPARVGTLAARRSTGRIAVPSRAPCQDDGWPCKPAIPCAVSLIFSASFPRNSPQLAARERQEPGDPRLLRRGYHPEAPPPKTQPRDRRRHRHHPPVPMRTLARLLEILLHPHPMQAPAPRRITSSVNARP